MKKNEKGFILAEAIIVSVFIVGLFAYMATNIFPLITRYKIALRFDNPNEIYLANVLYDEMIKDKERFSELNAGDLGINTSRFYRVYTFKNGKCSYMQNTTKMNCTDIIFDDSYIAKLASNDLKIDKVAVVKNLSSIDKSDSNMVQYLEYETKKLSLKNNPKVYLLIKFTNGNFAYVATDY